MLDRFVAAFGVWEEALPYLHLMFDKVEMRLVVAMAGCAVTPAEAARLLDVPPGEAARLLEAVYGRSILDKAGGAGAVRYTVAGFDHFLDYFAKYGPWDEIPREARRALDARFLAHFVERQRAAVQAMMRGKAPAEPPPNDAVLLLPEAEEMVRAAQHIVVQPCDCRRLGQNCQRPVDTCLWLDDLALVALDRGQGRRLSQDEALAVLRRAHRRGLMHTGDAGWRERGLQAICNCCACDCYPFRASQVLGSKGIWPRTRYVAAHDPEACNLCGACVRRCHFGAFYHGDDVVAVEGRERQAVLYEPARCWGCGLCASTCPAGAIQMVRVEACP
ncbi:MAG: 4Fe-4S binding protein [Anaerolineae bacterium]